MRMGRTQDGGVLEARDRREIIDEARATRKKRLILLARDGLPDPRLTQRLG
jgi:uncharacterized membrane protein